jgi:hypothetical protein
MTQPKTAGGDRRADPRASLMARHIEARARRNAAPLGGDAWEQAQAEVARIEIEIARLDREADPPRG